MLWGGRREMATSSLYLIDGVPAMPQPNDLSRSLVALDQNSTIIAVIELSQSSWLVAGMLPGIDRQPRKKLEPSPERLLGLLHRWRDEAVRAGRTITRIALAFEAGRDGFWLARWLAARGIEAYVIHASSVAVSREHRRAKTDRLDTELLKRGFLGWLRGERGHCSMARVPTIAEEDAKRPNLKAILVYDVSRWGRFQDADESAYYEYICRESGIEVRYCVEQFENDGSIASTIVKTVKRAMAGEYSRELSSKVFAGQARLIELGFKQGGFAGYGLRRRIIDQYGNPKAILAFGERK